MFVSGFLSCLAFSAAVLADLGGAKLASRSRLSGPLRLRVQSRSRTWLRIAASIAFLFRACFKETPVCSQNFCSQFLCTLDPPPPNEQNDGFPLEFLLEGPQTELRTLSQNCEQTPQKLRTNRIMNKRAFLSFKWGLKSYSTTIARLSPPSGLERGG